jgi:acyl-CoA synthetase (AMP-forming)/AMP-acid ligase II
MPGYWQRPDETAKVMTPDGFFRSGDVAVLQEDGQIKIVDRIKDMVLVSGFNVYPNEVEEVLAKHPAVAEVAVVGLPDTDGSEVVAAYVVPNQEKVTPRRAARILPPEPHRLQGAPANRVQGQLAENERRQGSAPRSAGRSSGGEEAPVNFVHEDEARLNGPLRGRSALRS